MWTKTMYMVLLGWGHSKFDAFDSLLFLVFPFFVRDGEGVMGRSGNVNIVKP